VLGEENQAQDQPVDDHAFSSGGCARAELRPEVTSPG
jgi:hypothetical protein